MIPSDHFVYFYNEIFKELEKLGPEALDKYYQRVANRQAFFTLDAFKKDGLQGMIDYWSRIAKEENCKASRTYNLKEGWIDGGQDVCPSLTKALESDAGPCRVYCDHCPGWSLRVLAWSGHYAVYNLIDRRKPQCRQYIARTRELAEKRKAEWLKKYDASLIYDNFAEVEKVKAGELK